MTVMFLLEDGLAGEVVERSGEKGVLGVKGLYVFDSFESSPESSFGIRVRGKWTF